MRTRGNTRTTGGRTTGGRGRRRSRAALATAVVVAAVTAGALLAAAGCSNSPATNPLTGQGSPGHVLAAKIDNVGAAQNQLSGLNSADLVYVIQVEGGLSRYLAVFDSSTAPDVRVGPLRSARQTDIPLLAPFGRVGLAYTGAISGLLPDLAAANLQNITPAVAPKLFSNGGSSPTYLTTSAVFAAYPNLAETQNVGFQFGAAPSGGQPATSASANLPAASFTFTASGQKWLVTVDGRALTSSGQGRLSADNVIIQHVHVVAGKYTDHNAGHADNEVFSQTTGSGQADFYRGGQVWHGQWSKANDSSPTDYTVGGSTMLLAPGRTWIVLEGS